MPAARAPIRPFLAPSQYAGIVADSVPESEYQECLNKTRSLVRAVELARPGE
jgi:hypothetical protein